MPIIIARIIPADPSYPDALRMLLDDGSMDLGGSGEAIAVSGASGGGITSAAVTMPVEFTTTGSPLTGAGGTIAVAKATQLASTVWAAPTGGVGVPTFRLLQGVDLPVFTDLLAGAVPASGGGTTNFLRADGTWATPPAGGSLFTDIAAGTVPASGGGTATFLRADGTWASPASLGVDTIVALADADAPGFTLTDGATAFQTNSVTPAFVDIPNIFFALDAKSYYEINFYAIASCPSPTEGVNFKLLTDGSEYHFQGSLRTQTNTASTSVNLAMNLTAAQGETPLITATPNQEYMVEIRVLIRTNTAQTVKFQMAMESGTFTGNLWHPTFARARKIRSNAAWA